MHTSIHSGRTGNHPASPHAMVLRLASCSSRRSGFLVTVTPEKLASQELDASVEASEPHDFAVRMSAVRQKRRRVHRIQPRVRDDRDTPLQWRGRPGYKSDLRFRKIRIFFATGLDNPNHVDPAGEIRFYAQLRGGAPRRPSAQCGLPLLHELTVKHWRPPGIARDDNFEMARTPADATLLSTERRMTPSAVHRHRICGHS